MDNRAQIIIGADNQAGPGISRAKKDLRELGTAADRSGRQTKDSFRQATVSSNSLSGSISKLYVGMASLAALVGAGAVARGFLETAAAMERTELMLVGLEGSSAKAQKSMEWILNFAGSAPYKLSALSDTFVKIRVAGIDPTAGSMQALVDAVAAFGGSNEQLQRASVAIMQMAGKGVISMEELRQQLGEAVPDAIHVMAHEMDMTVRDLVDMISKGNLDALTGLTALFEGWAKKHKGAAETFAGSMSGLWNQLKLQYELFKNDMMTSGDSFITIKAALKTVLDLVKRWREDGSIVEWSEYAVKAMGVVVMGVHYVGKAFLGWKIIWEGLKVAFDAFQAGIWKSLSWLADKIGVLLGKLADIQKFLNMDVAADQNRIAAASMREWADETSRAADILIDDIATKGVKGIEDVVAATINLDQKTAQLKASFYDNVEAMKAQAKAGKDAGSAMAEGTDKTAKVLEKLDPKLEAAHQKLHDFLAIHSQADDAARKIAALNIEYDRMAEQLTDMQLAGFEVIEMSEQLEQWYANSMEDITKKTEETTDTIYDTWSHMYERLQDITADWIYDMKVDFDSIVDLFKRSVAEMISAWIWGQQSMQFAPAGQGGLSLGSMFGGMFGGGEVYGAGDPGSSSFVGPLQQGVQGASSAYSLYGAYGAYNTAGGGWAGLQAGAGSFFGAGGAGAGGAGAAGGGWASSSMMGVPVWGWIAAAATFALDQFAKANLRSGQAEMNIGAYSPRDAEYLGSALGGDFFNDPFQEWVLGGLYGKGDRHTYGAYIDYGLKEGDLKTGTLGVAGMATDPTAGWAKMLGLDRGVAGWILNPIGTFITSILENKKRSYLTQEYDYGYSLDEGWGQTGMIETKEKRKGEDFREAAASMSEGIINILNSFEETTEGFLGIIDEKWVNQFKTSMMELGDLGFKFDISAEDKGEFEDDMQRSFSAALEGVINPVVSIAVDFMRQATEEAFTSPEIEKVFGMLNEDISTYLRKGMADVLAVFDAPMPTTVTEFEAFVESLSANMEEVGAILEYFQTITALTDEISSGLARSSLTQSIIDINTNFLSLGETLMSVGVDLEKYPDFVRAWGIALAEATYGFSVDNVVQGLKDIMDAPSAMQAAEAFTLGFMEQVRDGMVNSITSAFTEMMYAQMLAPLAETFLEGAETPDELMAGIHNYISAVRDIMQDPAMITGLQSIGAAMWEINQMIPSAEQLATPIDSMAATFESTSAQVSSNWLCGSQQSASLLIEGGQTAASYIASAAKALANVGGTAVPMQHGAIVTRPTYSLLGEAGYPEVVLPLGGGHKLTAQLENGGAQNVAITIPVTVVTEDGRVLKQEIIKETISEIKERSGRREFVIHV